MDLKNFLLVVKGFIDGVVIGGAHSTQLSTVGLFRYRSLAGGSLFCGLLHFAGELVGGVKIFWLKVYMKVCSTMSFRTLA